MGRESTPRGSSPAALSAAERRLMPDSHQIFICCSNCCVKLLVCLGFYPEREKPAPFCTACCEWVFFLEWSNTLIFSSHLLSPPCLVGILFVNKLLYLRFVSLSSINIHFLLVERDYWNPFRGTLIRRVSSPKFVSKQRHHNLSFS